MKILYSFCKSRIFCPEFGSSVLLLGILCLTMGLFCAGCGEDSGSSSSSSSKILKNVSYDPTRELYVDFNRAFTKYWAEKSDEHVEILQSHGGSGRQSRSVIDGNDADVVTLATAFDIDAIAKARPQLIAKDWQAQLPHNSCPYTSTIVFLVRKGNPKNIKDWDDLLRPNVQIITPDPQTSGGARWNYLAAWGFALKKELGGDLAILKDPSQKDKVAAAEKKAFEFVKALFNDKKAPVKDSGARGATHSFVENNRGDVLLAWENEAILSKLMQPNAALEIITPSVSILAEPAVAVVTGYTTKNGTGELANEYLNYLYSPEGQAIVAKHHYRPGDPEVLKEVLADPAMMIRPLELFTIEEVCGGWNAAQKKHFDKGGTYERIATER